jgi:hypothetical protein
MKIMAAQYDPFAKSIALQIAINKQRTPTERFQALCDLLDAAHAMAPTDPAAIERRRRVLAARAAEKEQMRANLRRLRAAYGAGADASV